MKVFVLSERKRKKNTSNFHLLLYIYKYCHLLQETTQQSDTCCFKGWGQKYIAKLPSAYTWWYFIYFFSLDNKAYESFHTDFRVCMHIDISTCVHLHILSNINLQKYHRCSVLKEILLLSISLSLFVVLCRSSLFPYIWKLFHMYLTTITRYFRLLLLLLPSLKPFDQRSN